MHRILNPHNTDDNAVLQAMAAGRSEDEARAHVAETLTRNAAELAAVDDSDRTDELLQRAAELTEAY